MKPITALVTYAFFAITVLGLLVFPIFIIMESRGNPVLTRSHPEDTQDRIESLIKALGIDFLMLVNTLAFIYIDQRQQIGRQLQRHESEEETDL